MAKIDLDAGEGEADYFSAILALQNKAEPSTSLPEVLLNAAKLVQDAFIGHNAPPIWPKPVVVNAAALATLGSNDNLRILQRQADNAHTLIVLDQAAVIAVCALLLGGKQVAVLRTPTRIESQIVNAFLAQLGPDFKPVEAPQTSIIWQDYVGAKLTFSGLQNDPAIIVMINRRSENTGVFQSIVRNETQQTHVRQAVGHGVLNVDYVMDGGMVPLSLLQGLKVGSVFPCGSLDDTAVEARANGQTVMSGALNLTAERLRFDITRLSVGGK